MGVDTNQLNYSFGNWVRRRRKALDMTQNELAGRVGCSVSAVFKIEADQRRPSRQVAELLANVLDIPSGQRNLFLKVARQEKAVDSLLGISPVEQPVQLPAVNIPLSPKPILGREHELGEIMSLLRDPQCRLLTLTGLGGVGKTHLATHLAASLAGSAETPAAVLVSLAPVTGREQAVTAVADGLGIVLYSAGDRASQLITYLRERELYLVLDNFEHLVSDRACVDLVGEILMGAQRVKILITSRQPLQLQAEWVFEVQGLPIPSGPNTAELVKNSAVALFLQRAYQAVFGFKPRDEDLPAIAQICELVEGLPLGIELAATWVRTLSLREIAAEIQASMDFLASTSYDLPERQRSLRATIEYSWRLLLREEQLALKRLSIFRGGFSRQAAQEVANASLPVLSALISKSLVRRLPDGRYDMHDLIQQYAWERLQEDADAGSQVQALHSRFFADLLEQRGPALKGAGRPAVVQELISEGANLRQAWQWAAEQGQSSEISRAADTLFWFYESRSNCREGAPLFGGAVSGLQDPQNRLVAAGDWQHGLALARVLSYRGYFLFRQGQHPQSRQALQSSLDLLRAIPERGSEEVQAALSTTSAFLGTVLSVMGEFEEGDRLLDEALFLKQDLHDLWGAAFCLRQIGFSAYQYRGDHERAFLALQQSLRLSQELGNAWSTAASLTQLGLVVYARGDYPLAHSYLTGALRLSRSLEDRASIAVALDSLGLVEVAQGNHAEALRLLDESIVLWSEIGEQGSLAGSLNHYGELLLRMGELGAARGYFHKTLSIAQAMHTLPVLLDALVGEAEIQILEGSLDSALGILLAVAENSSSSFATQARAGKLRTAVESRLPAVQSQAVQARAVEAIIQDLIGETRRSVPIIEL